MITECAGAVFPSMPDELINPESRQSKGLPWLAANLATDVFVSEGTPQVAKTSIDPNLSVACEGETFSAKSSIAGTFFLKALFPDEKPSVPCPNGSIRSLNKCAVRAVVGAERGLMSGG